jgi:hypothetical protein
MTKYCNSNCKTLRSSPLSACTLKSHASQRPRSDAAHTVHTVHRVLAANGRRAHGRHGSLTPVDCGRKLNLVQPLGPALLLQPLLPLPSARQGLVSHPAMPSCPQQPWWCFSSAGLSQEKASGPPWALACSACLLVAACQKRGGQRGRQPSRRTRRVTSSVASERTWATQARELVSAGLQQVSNTLRQS